MKYVEKNFIVDGTEDAVLIFVKEDGGEKKQMARKSNVKPRSICVICCRVISQSRRRVSNYTCCKKCAGAYTEVYKIAQYNLRRRK